MSSNIPTPKAGEADPCCVITFVVLPQQEGSIPIEIDCGTTHVIGGLKEDYTDLFGIPAEQQMWTYNGQILQDDNTLRSYGIDPSSNTTFEADEASPFTKIKFCVNSCSSTNVLHIDCVTTIMIGGLKEDLRNYCNIPAEHQVWTYNNQTLSDERTLKSYGITEESNIIIQISERRF